MTVQSAIKALQENAEHQSYDVPTKIFEQSLEATANALMFTRYEDDCCQYRSNQEWTDLIFKENDPLEAAKLVPDWLNDKAQAWEKLESDEEEAPVSPNRAAVFETTRPRTAGKIAPAIAGTRSTQAPREVGVPPQPDSQKAQEAASADEKRIEGAAWTWGKLTGSDRQIVREVTDRICGDGKGEQPADGLNIRLQPEQPQPDVTDYGSGSRLIGQ
ncbi:MAG TPA: hypothetical protein VIW07_13325 [Candidatus Udaeobacter sp.]|jgi:hypothetical protein